MRDLLYDHTIQAEAVKAAPAVGVAASSLAGVPWDTIVYILTAVYVLLQIIFIVRDKWWRDKDGSE
jgi:hypothetical protein